MSLIWPAPRRGVPSPGFARACCRGATRIPRPAFHRHLRMQVEIVSKTMAAPLIWATLMSTAGRTMSKAAARMASAGSTAPWGVPATQEAPRGNATLIMSKPFRLRGQAELSSRCCRPFSRCAHELNSASVPTTTLTPLAPPWAVVQLAAVCICGEPGHALTCTRRVLAWACCCGCWGGSTTSAPPQSD